MILIRFLAKLAMGAILLASGCASVETYPPSAKDPTAAQIPPAQRKKARLPQQWSDLEVSVPLADADDILQRYQEELLASRSRLVLLQHLGEDALYLRVNVAGDQVMLSGLLPEEDKQVRAAAAVAALQGVGKVVTRFVSQANDTPQVPGTTNATQSVQNTLFQVQNQLLAHQIELDLLQNMGADALAIDVKVHQNIAELQGTVPSREASRLANARAERFPDIHKVENRLWVSPRSR